MRAALCFVAAVAACAASEVSVVPVSPRQLHDQYYEIFRYGNRNAASHRWVTYILERAALLSDATLEVLFSSFCAVSGSPLSPSDYKRYRLHLARADDGATIETGFLYFCCWPCVCDTWDFIKVDTRTVATAEGPRQRRFVVIGDPCGDEAALDAPFVQPFDGRSTTLRRDAPEVRCVDGRLEGATLSDRGHVIIGLFFDAPEDDDGRGGALVAPRPGRVTTVDGLAFQDDVEYTGECALREANGFDSGMGEIFRRVAAVAPIAPPPPPLSAP